MDEIEKDQDLEFNFEENKEQKWIQSPVHPLMGDTPSNYNIPNQRYQTIPHESLDADNYVRKKTNAP